ncbi:MAG: sugar phosphate isomerase/epimerase family protein [bacterium]
MKLGLLTAALAELPFEEMLDRVAALGLEAIELHVALAAHCPAEALLKSKDRRKRWLAEIERRGLIISSLSAHGNPLHPDPQTARRDNLRLRHAISLAQKLGVGRVNGFSGCPADPGGGSVPNWVTCPWPTEYAELVAWQWEAKAIPYWTRTARFAADRGVHIGLEMHPGFLVYNPETLLRLRSECGEAIGANLDPSHLFWQGIDPLEAVRALGPCIWHVHAKDCRLEPANVRLNGVLDTKHYGQEARRAWVFRTVGYGHGESFWRDFVSALRVAGYDHVLSIEHEDSLMSVGEGIEKAAQFLQPLLIRQPPTEMYWA